MTATTIVLTHRVKTRRKKHSLVLALSANDRTRLRGLRQTTCGQEVLLKLPREGPLLDGDLLEDEESLSQVLVTAANEDLIEVKSESKVDLIKAAYHLGNRHVELEVQAQRLYLLNDTVLVEMLESRGLILSHLKRPFFPEIGAYLPPHKH